MTPLGNATVALRGAAINSSPALVSDAESCAIDPAVTGPIASTLSMIGGGVGVGVGGITSDGCGGGVGVGVATGVPVAVVDGVSTVGAGVVLGGTMRAAVAVGVAL